MSAKFQEIQQQNAEKCRKRREKYDEETGRLFDAFCKKAGIDKSSISILPEFQTFFMHLNPAAQLPSGDSSLEVGKWRKKVKNEETVQEPIIPEPPHVSSPKDLQNSIQTAITPEHTIPENLPSTSPETERGIVSPGGIPENLPSTSSVTSSVPIRPEKKAAQCIVCNTEIIERHQCVFFKPKAAIKIFMAGVLNGAFSQEYAEKTIVKLPLKMCVHHVETVHKWMCSAVGCSTAKEMDTVPSDILQNALKVYRALKNVLELHDGRAATKAHLTTFKWIIKGYFKDYVPRNSVTPETPENPPSTSSTTPPVSIEGKQVSPCILCNADIERHQCVVLKPYEAMKILMAGVLNGAFSQEYAEQTIVKHPLKMCTHHIEPAHKWMCSAVGCSNAQEIDLAPDVSLLDALKTYQALRNVRDSYDGRCPTDTLLRSFRKSMKIYFQNYVPRHSWTLKTMKNVHVSERKIKENLKALREAADVAPSMPLREFLRGENVNLTPEDEQSLLAALHIPDPLRRSMCTDEMMSEDEDSVQEKKRNRDTRQLYYKDEELNRRKMMELREGQSSSSSIPDAKKYMRVVTKPGQKAGKPRFVIRTPSDALVMPKLEPEEQQPETIFVKEKEIKEEPI